MLEIRAHVEVTLSESLLLFSRCHLIGDVSVEYSCELISTDCRLTQSEMIFWAVDVEAVYRSSCISR